jgi:hypothetical protein
VIGVSLSDYDHYSVGEFFELFKTPWEYFRAETSYDVVICDSATVPIVDARLVIVIHRFRGAQDAAGSVDSEPREPTLMRFGQVIFPVYGSVVYIDSGVPIIYAGDFERCVGSYAYNEDKTVLNIGYDFFNETGLLLSSGQPVAYASFPTLDLHVANLRRWILAAGLPLAEVPPTPYADSFFACLTHDVDFAGIRNHFIDQTFAGFLYRAIVKSAAYYIRGEYTPNMAIRNWRAVATLPLVYMGLVRDFWSTFRTYQKYESPALSTFFFVPFKGYSGNIEGGRAPKARAVKYDVKKLHREIRYLVDRGCEIGVHGIDSWQDVESGKREIKRIVEICGQQTVGVRMHWLYFDSRSPRTLENAGYSFDSTFGYNETIGYRAGVSQVYKFPGAKVLCELPMHIMDTALFYPKRRGLGLGAGMSEINKLIQHAARFGGVLTFNWHDRSIAPERLWDTVYRDILAALKAQGAVFLTASAVVEWFKIRRRIVFDRVSLDGASHTVTFKNLDVARRDRLMLRIYSSSGRSFHLPSVDADSRSHSDFLLSSSPEGCLRVDCGWQPSDDDRIADRPCTRER